MCKITDYDKGLHSFEFIDGDTTRLENGDYVLTYEEVCTECGQSREIEEVIKGIPLDKEIIS